MSHIILHLRSPASNKGYSSLAGLLAYGYRCVIAFPDASIPVACDRHQPYTVAGTAPDLSPDGYISLDSLLYFGLWPRSPIIDCDSIKGIFARQLYLTSQQSFSKQTCFSKLGLSVITPSTPISISQRISASSSMVHTCTLIPSAWHCFTKEGVTIFMP